MFIYDGQVTALLGVDLNSSAGTFPLVLTLHDGRQVSKDLVVEQRTVILNPFEIPDSLGGNTPQGIKQLISTLALEGKTINAIPTDGKKLWTEKFRYPLNSPIVVADPYGYTRVISNFTMPHKGTDFEAPIGTPVYAMNRGVVRFTDTLRNYGKTILIDHGIGLQTVYMHLSEISVTNGQMVEKGELIGLSGDTGYVLGPHLHLTVRIWDISIDSIKFLDLLGEVN
jgi:murein DD-endopeptidase MepM/ murein hydrolase activator NlpD